MGNRWIIISPKKNFIWGYTPFLDKAVCSCATIRSASFTVDRRCAMTLQLPQLESDGQMGCEQTWSSQLFFTDPSVQYHLLFVPESLQMTPSVVFCYTVHDFDCIPSSLKFAWCYVCYSGHEFEGVLGGGEVGLRLHLPLPLRNESGCCRKRFPACSGRLAQTRCTEWEL